MVRFATVEFISCMGLKKAAQSGTPSDFVMRLPIQRPKIENQWKSFFWS